METMMHRLPRWAAALIVAVIAIVITFASIYSAVLPTLIPWVSEAIGNDSPNGLALGVYALVAAVTIPVSVVLCWLLGRWLANLKFRDLRLQITGSAMGWMLAMTGLAFAIAALTGLLTMFTPAVDGFEPISREDQPWWVAIVYILILAFLLQGIMEEIVWRGWVPAMLGNTRLSLWVSVLGFTSIHLLSSGGQQQWWHFLLYLAIPFGFALAAAVATFASDSVWAGVGVHAGLHTSNILAIALGTAQGPWNWLITGGLWAIAGFVLWHLYADRMPWRAAATVPATAL